MARRSLQASEAGITAIKAALKQQKLSQEYIAGVANCSRQTIWSLLQGNAVDYETLMKVCKELKLDWEIVTVPAEDSITYQLDELVQEVRGQVKQYIDEYCSTMRVLNMSQKIELGDIYTNVNILQKLTRDRQLRIDELLELSRDRFDLLARGEFRKKGVPGLEVVQAHSKLMVFGKPGAGKTTFLKFVALQCSAGELFPKLIPLFISLKEWAEAPEKVGLIERLINLFASYGIAPNADVKQGVLGFLMNRDRDRDSAQERVNLTAVEEVLREGRVLLLLDGLDEVRDVDSKRVSREIEEFARQFPKNRYVVTCRIAAKDYVFQQFAEVEVADFNEEQVDTFISNWFRIRELPQVAKRLTRRLKDNEPMRELACSPILLTLLCLVFEESGELSPNRAELYKRGLDLLLSRWDAMRGIERDQVYQRLSVRAKEEMLSEIAFDYFERGEYFFKQESVTKEIASCLYNLPGADEGAEDLRVTAGAVLKAVEAQHGLLMERASGIYSFSHLTFQEYLTARWIRESRQEETLNQLVKHLHDPQWREVFLLTAGMLNREGANQLLLLMQFEIRQLVVEDETIQKWLAWLSAKTESVGETAYKSVAVRAVYIGLSAHALALALDLNLARARSLDLDLSRALDLARAHALDLARALDLDLDLSRALDLALARAHDIDIALDRAVDLTLDLNLARTLDLDLARNLALDLYLTRARARTRDMALALALDIDLALNLDLARTRAVDLALNHTKSNYPLKYELQKLQAELPEVPKGSKQKFLENYITWWKANGQVWSNRLCQVMIDHRNVGQDWQFSSEQVQLLNRYLEANKLVADCLNTDCYISRDVRQDIEATMLMSQSFIDEHRRKKASK